MTKIPFLEKIFAQKKESRKPANSSVHLDPAQRFQQFKQRRDSLQQQLRENEKELAQQWVAEYRAGIPSTEIGKRYRVDPRTVRRSMQRIPGFQLRDPGNPGLRSPETFQRWLTMIRQGVSVRRIAKLERCSTHSIYKAFRDHNISASQERRDAIYPKRVEIILQGIRENKSWAEIGKDCNLTATRCHAFIQEHGRNQNPPWTIIKDRKVADLDLNIHRQCYEKRLSGKSWKQVAAEMQRTVQATYRLALRYAKRESKPWPIPIYPSDMGKQAYEMRLQGMKWRDIAARLQRSLTNTHNLAKTYAIQNSLPWTPKKSSSTPDLEENLS